MGLIEGGLKVVNFQWRLKGYTVVIWLDAAESRGKDISKYGILNIID